MLHNASTTSRGGVGDQIEALITLRLVAEYLKREEQGRNL
jgi:hypothetical protein